MCAFFVSPRARAQIPSVSVVVEVSNGTANGTTVVGDPVLLRVFRNEQLVDSLEATVAKNGKATFDGVPTGQQIVAIPIARHQSMAFQGGRVTLAAAKGELSTVVHVFDVSSDTSALSVGTHHMTIAIRGAAIEITEYMQLRNSSDMAVRGSKRDALNRPIVTEIMLPAGATDLTPSGFLDPNALVRTETGFYDTLAVPPGEHQVRFSYRIPIDSSTVEIAKGISLPTSELIVFWEKDQGELTGLGEPDERLINAQGVPVAYFRRQDLQRGERITFEISGFDMERSETTTWFVLAVVFGVIFVIALLRLLRGPVPSASSESIK